MDAIPIPCGMWLLLCEPAHWILATGPAGCMSEGASGGARSVNSSKHFQVIELYAGGYEHVFLRAVVYWELLTTVNTSPQRPEDLCCRVGCSPRRNQPELSTTASSSRWT